MTNEEVRNIVEVSLRDDLIDTKTFFPRVVREKCLEALEKQIPKKPKSEQGVYICPTCGDDFNMNEYVMSCCWECGQRLDWGDEDD